MRTARNIQGFTFAELLIVIAIVGVLGGVALPAFSQQMERARLDADKAVAEQGYAAAVSRYVAEGRTGATYYVFDGGSGQIYSLGASEGKVSDYGFATTEADYQVGGLTVTGVASEGGHLTYCVREGRVTAIGWGKVGHGQIYTSAAGLYSLKGDPLTAASADERLSADIDCISAMGDYYLGMTKDEILEVTGTPAAYGERLKNNEGVNLFTYRNQGGTNPQVRMRDLSLRQLNDLGFTGVIGQQASNSFSDSTTRALLSDFANAGIEVHVMMGKVEYDANGRANKIHLWVTVQNNAAEVVEPLRDIVVAC